MATISLASAYGSDDSGLGKKLAVVLSRRRRHAERRSVDLKDIIDGARCEEEGVDVDDDILLRFRPRLLLLLLLIGWQFILLLVCR